MNENGVILSAFQRWTWTYDILFEDAENMLIINIEKLRRSAHEKPWNPPQMTISTEGFYCLKNVIGSPLSSGHTK